MSSSDINFNSPIFEKRRKWRHVKDAVTRNFMVLGGVSIITIIVLIAVYLFYVVMPIFKPADMELVKTYSMPGNTNSNSVIYAMEEQHEVGLRITDQGEVLFFSMDSGEIIKEFDLELPENTKITTTSKGDPSQQTIALGLSDGSVLLLKHNYKITYPDDVRLIVPDIIYPFGKKPLQISDNSGEIEQLSVQYDGEKATIVAKSNVSNIYILSILQEENEFTEEFETIEQKTKIDIGLVGVEILRLDVDQEELYIVDKENNIHYYNVANKDKPQLIQIIKPVEDGVNITAFEMLSGGISVLVGDSIGRISQWFPVRDEANKYNLKQIRVFEKDKKPIKIIVPEYFRKGFFSIDLEGNFGVHYATSHRTLFYETMENMELMAVAPRADAILFETSSGSLQYWHIDNEYPEISWSSIWAKVWYESRDKPEYVWQSSSASSDFEPKYSLVPLVFGTFKAVFYAMLLAIPLSIFGAIYTAYFMAPELRLIFKPTIEIMEALPTVILGFLAGLWLAPIAEKNLIGMFVVMLSIPIAIILVAWFWRIVPKKLRSLIPDGWEVVILIPVIILVSVFSFQLGHPIERVFFNGDVLLWLNQNMGITYDQRNSLIVGIAMGFAVIPTIFSISEDAIFGVPKHLIRGSLALGATSWQTMIRVVLLTASPAIFSAVMIGFGRAVGETMIVVMATGNTAIMDMDIFQGFRALSANIAVEMPESEVGSTHYRILFLAALVLFVASFFFNTIAEVVRQRLRVKYSSL